MLTKKELQNAIDQFESAPMTYQNCEKLATFYALYDHMYGERVPQEENYSRKERADETKIKVSGTSEFLRLINGKSSEKVWQVMDELMETIQITSPRLYNGVIRKIEDL